MRHSESHDMDGETERILRRWDFFTATSDLFLCKNQLKRKIRAERQRLSSKEFSERGVNIAFLCSVKKKS